MTDNNNERSNNWWVKYIYTQDFPVSCEIEDSDGKTLSTKVFAGEAVQFKVKRVTECIMPYGALFQEFKFICVLRSFFSKEAPLAHHGAVYHILGIGGFNPTNGRYIITKMMVDGEKLPKEPDTEHLYQFVNDVVNEYVYSSASFYGMEKLIKLPNLYQKGSLAILADSPDAKKLLPTEPKALKGVKYFDTRVDASVKKYPVIKLQNGFAGIDMGSKLIAFHTSDVATFVDTSGFHTDRADEKHKIDVYTNNETGYNAFCEKYCK